MSANAASIDPADVARFEALGEEGWSETGAMAPLHRLNPLRIGWLLNVVQSRIPGERAPSLNGLTILDIGCGAGILSEPLSRLGADVLGIDPAPGNIDLARRHASEAGAPVRYRCASLEEIADETARFDLVLAMEVVEHVRDVPGFIGRACGLLRPGGVFIASTLNRTLRSFALAIIGAEYVLRWLPAGTHRWEQFVTPEELANTLRASGWREVARTGVVYSPIRRDWRLSLDVGVNYMMAATRIAPIKPKS